MVTPDKIFGRLGNRLFQMAFIYAQMKKGIVKDFYCQDFTLFDEHKDEIKQWFGEGIGYLPYVAVHLRVGANPINPDEPKYIDNPYYVPLCKTGYYIDAINQFPNRKFIIFSDDVPFARTYFEGDKFTFDESADEIEAFNKMASCDSHIIANSSFSFMAAYVCPHPQKKVVAPNYEKWYTSGNTTQTVIPKEWIQL